MNSISKSAEVGHKIIRGSSNKSILHDMTYIVALTAHTNTQIEEECLKAGMKRVLNKPLTLSVLTEIMWQYYFKS